MCACVWGREGRVEFHITANPSQRTKAPIVWHVTDTLRGSLVYRDDAVLLSDRDLLAN